MAPAVVAGVLALVGGIASAVGSINQANAATAAARFNSKIANQNADLAIARSKEEERRHRILARKRLGSIRAGFGASGVTLEGSPLDVLEESAAAAELDSLTIRNQGLVDQFGFLATSKLQDFKGAAARRTGAFRTAGILISAGGQATSDFSAA